MKNIFKKLVIPLLFTTTSFGIYKLSNKFNLNNKIEFKNNLIQEVSCEDIPYTGKPGTKYERTFMAIKPDGVQRNLVGEIIKRMEKKGFILVGLKMVQPSEDLARFQSFLILENTMLT
jgi:hypothetical protein